MARYDRRPPFLGWHHPFGWLGGVSKYKGCARPARRTPIFARERNERRARPAPTATIERPGPEALRGEIRIPGSFSKSSIWRRNPARARDRLPASSGRPALQTCAADSAALRSKAQTVEKPLILGRAAFLAPFRRSQRLQEMLRHKASGLRPKPRQGDDPPAPHTLSAA